MISAKRVSALIVAPLLALVVAHPADARSKRPQATWETHVWGIAMFGDSMTVGARPYLPRSWQIDARWGRGVSVLPERVDRYTGSHEYPRVVVIALGTNEQSGWTRRDYVDQVKKFPKATRFVFVTTFRRSGPATGGTYSRWMREIVAATPGAQIADWRSAAMADPTLVSDDGTHQSPAGKRVWAKLVREAVGRAGAHRRAR